jgi:hypothetical protein
MSAANTSYCLDLHNGNAVNDGKIKLYQTHKGEAQQWIFEKTGQIRANTINDTGTTTNSNKLNIKNNKQNSKDKKLNNNTNKQNNNSKPGKTVKIKR